MINTWTLDFCVDGDELWFVHGSMDILIHYSLSEKRMLDTYYFHEKIKESYAKYRRIIKYGDKIFIFPGFSDDIVIFDIDSKDFSYIKPKEYKLGTLIHNIYVENNVAYLIPMVYHYFMKLNLDSLQLEYLDNWKEVLGFEKTRYEDNYISSSCKVGKEIYFVMNNECLGIFDFELGLLKTQKIADRGTKFVEIASDDKCLFLYDKNTKEILKYSIEGDREKYAMECDLCYIRPLGNNEIAIDEIENSLIYILDADDLSVKRTFEFVYEPKKKMENPFYYNAWSSNDKNPIMISGRDNFIMNYITGEKESLFFSKDLESLFWKNYYLHYDLKENEGYRLNDFLNDI